MSMTYYTVDDLRPGRSGWGVKRFSALNDAISHYRSLPMDGVRVLGMADDAHAYELIRCVRLFPGDAQGEDVLAADHWRDGLTKKNAALKDALDICLESLRPRFLLEPERLIPIPQHKKLRKELREYRRAAGQRFCVLRRRKGIFGVVRGGCCLRLVRLLRGRQIGRAHV